MIMWMERTFLLGNQCQGEWPRSLKARLNGFNIVPTTKVGRMLGKCWMKEVFKRFQCHSTFSRTIEMLKRC